jgi:hypothetical protein
MSGGLGLGPRSIMQKKALKKRQAAEARCRVPPLALPRQETTEQAKPPNPSSTSGQALTIP